MDGDDCPFFNCDPLRFELPPKNPVKPNPDITSLKRIKNAQVFLFYLNLTVVNLTRMQRLAMPRIVNWLGVALHLFAQLKIQHL